MYAYGTAAVRSAGGDDLDEQLEDLLARLGYLQFRDVFVREHLTYEALKEFGKDDMKELGLPAGPRIAIYNALHKQ